MTKIIILRPTKITSKVEHDFLFPMFRCINYLRDIGYRIVLKNKLDSSLYNCDILCVLSTCIRHHGEDNVYMEKLRNISESSRLTYFFDISDSGGIFYQRGFEIGKIYYKKQLYYDRSYYVSSSTLDPRMHCDSVMKKNSIKKEFSNIPNNYKHIGSKQVNEIRISWNVGLGDYRAFSFPSKTLLRNLIKLQTKVYRRAINFPTFKSRYNFTQFKNRNIDILSCFGSYKNISKLISLHREETADKVSLLMNDYQVITGFLPFKTYSEHLKYSKIALSPFGWGEMTWKDFEVFVNGITLLKPNMNHIESWPNYYINNQTYLPYSWDARDMNEVIKKGLSNLGFVEEIAQNGQERFLFYNVDNNPEPFVHRFKTVFG